MRDVVNPDHHSEIKTDGGSLKDRLSASRERRDYQSSQSSNAGAHKTRRDERPLIAIKRVRGGSLKGKASHEDCKKGTAGFHSLRVAGTVRLRKQAQWKTQASGKWNHAQPSQAITSKRTESAIPSYRAR